jgi:hypothetical protein
VEQEGEHHVSALLRTEQCLAADCLQPCIFIGR